MYWFCPYSLTSHPKVGTDTTAAQEHWAELPNRGPVTPKRQQSKTLGCADAVAGIQPVPTPGRRRGDSQRCCCSPGQAAQHPPQPSAAPGPCQAGDVISDPARRRKAAKPVLYCSFRCEAEPPRAGCCVLQHRHHSINIIRIEQFIKLLNFFFKKGRNPISKAV